MADIGLRPAHALAEAIRRREISSRELLEHYLARVDALNPALNAVVTLDPDGARRAADAADGALARGEQTGPLHGVPMTIKDTYQTAGMRTTCGLPAWDHVPERDAEAVRRLRDAGAVIFGKTNTPMLAGDWQTYNTIFGTTNNPWDTARTPGGSSGGAAAAVAAGMTALELGSDIGGSIRFPSSWCGVYGHKSSWGIVPQTGHMPPAPGTQTVTDLSVVGPLARDVADLELALGVLAGPAGLDAIAWRLELPPARATALRELRLALWLDDPAYPVDAEVAAALETAAGTLREGGARIVDARPAVALPDVMRLYQQLLYPILLSTISQRSFDSMAKLAESLPESDDRPLARTARFATQRHRDWLFANEKREQLRALMAEFFTDVDALLIPVAMVAAIPHDHSEPFYERVIEVNGETRPYNDLMAWMALATLTHLPATVVPVGRTESGLPVGIQIVGPHLEDHTTLAVGRSIEELLGGFVPPPGY
ncbi:amidase [Mycolicibacterium agri]|uniref:Amidase n=1 Tax=Mycolicibacterium agri TaxID=36811 RepID=A0A2A7NEP5_MYCAG|nr:amidase [Mycolicibacterium agri]PEG42340.1 amidase [Mycolicibacterium agri]GFG51199.1 amidase [Mycolicibacterium agri]